MRDLMPGEAAAAGLLIPLTRAAARAACFQSRNHAARKRICQYLENALSIQCVAGVWKYDLIIQFFLKALKY